MGMTRQNVFLFFYIFVFLLSLSPSEQSISEKRGIKLAQSLYSAPYVPRARATFVPDTAILVPTEQFWYPTKKLYNNNV
jgi:hypothetical protein